MFGRQMYLKLSLSWLAVPAMVLGSHAASAACATDAINLADLSFGNYADQNVDNNYQVVEDGCSMFIGKNSWVASNETFTITENTVLEFGYVGSAPGELHGLGFDQDIDGLPHGNRIFKVDWTSPDFGTYVGKKYQGGNAYEVFTVEIGKYFTGEDYHLVFMMDQDTDTGASGYYTNIRLVNKGETEPPTTEPPTTEPPTTEPPTTEPPTTEPPTTEPPTTEPPTTDPGSMSDFEVIDQGNGVALYSVANQDAWGGGDFYSCRNLEQECQPANLVDGRWVREHGPLAPGETYTAVLKVPGLGADQYPSKTFTWDGSSGSGTGGSVGGGNNGGNGGGVTAGCTDLECLEWQYSSHNSSDGMEPHNEGAVGPLPRTDGPAYLATPTNGSQPTTYGFAFDIDGSTLNWRWGGSIVKQAGDSGLEMHCSEDDAATFKQVAVSGGSASIPCSGDYIYFFRYQHPHSLNNDPGNAWIYTGGFTTAGARVNPNAYTPFTDGSANWMRFRHPVSQDGVTAAILDAQHNNDQLRRLDRYTIWFDDSPGNVQMGVDLGNAGDTLIRNEALRNTAGGPNGQQFFAVNRNPGFGGDFSYGQVIQFEFTAVAGSTGAQTYNDFSYYTVGHGWGAYGDPRLNSAGKAGTTMIFSDGGAYSDLEYNAVFTQPVTTFYKEEQVDDFLVGHHLFHGIDPKQIRSSAFDVVKMGERTCGDCHFRDGRGSEIIDTPNGPRLPPPTYGVKLLEAIPGREAGFTWEGTIDTVEEQVRLAFINDHKVDPDDLPGDVFDLVVAYTEALTVPNRKAGSYDLPGVAEGDELFTQVGCADCHTPVQKTVSSEPQWNNLTIRPYTDMKTWDLGEGSFRTPALWGLGHNIELLERNDRELLFMHDGSATSVDEAIQMHNGEASASKDAYNALGGGKQSIVNFVRTL